MIHRVHMLVKLCMQPYIMIEVNKPVFSHMDGHTIRKPFMIGAYAITSKTLTLAGESG